MIKSLSLNKQKGGTDINTVNLIGVKYNDKNQTTDFHNTFFLKNPTNLIIYNENYGQFKNKTDCSLGSGNGFLRQWRSDGPSCTKIDAFVYGIPTGTGDFIDNKSTIDYSIQQIIDCISKNTIVNVYFSVDVIPKNSSFQQLFSGTDLFNADIISLGIALYAEYLESIKAIIYITARLMFLFNNFSYFPENVFTTNLVNNVPTLVKALSIILSKDYDESLEKTMNSLITKYSLKRDELNLVSYEEAREKSYVKKLGIDIGSLEGYDDYICHHGLVNCGNSCYINSALQLLFSIGSFRENIIKSLLTEDIIQALKQIFIELSKSGNNPVDIENIIINGKTALNILLNVITESKGKMGDATELFNKLFEYEILKTFIKNIEFTQTITRTSTSRTDISSSVNTSSNIYTISLEEFEGTGTINFQQLLNSTFEKENQKTQFRTNTGELIILDKENRLIEPNKYLIINVNRYNFEDDKREKIDKRLTIEPEITIKDTVYVLLGFIQYPPAHYVFTRCYKQDNEIKFITYDDSTIIEGYGGFDPTQTAITFLYGKRDEIKLGMPISPIPSKSPSIPPIPSKSPSMSSPTPIQKVQSFMIKKSASKINDLSSTLIPEIINYGDIEPPSMLIGINYNDDTQIFDVGTDKLLICSNPKQCEGIKNSIILPEKIDENFINELTSKVIGKNIIILLTNDIAKIELIGLLLELDEIYIIGFNDHDQLIIANEIFQRINKLIEEYDSFKNNEKFKNELQYYSLALKYYINKFPDSDFLNLLNKILQENSIDDDIIKKFNTTKQDEYNKLLYDINRITISYITGGGSNLKYYNKYLKYKKKYLSLKLKIK
jgi:hypothetical protein